MKVEPKSNNLFYVILTITALIIPLGIWKFASSHAYNSKQHIVDTLPTYTLERDKYDVVTVNTWHYMTGAETGISTGYGGHSIAFLTIGIGTGKNAGQPIIGIFSVDQRIYYGDMSVMSRGVNCDDATIISKIELEDIILNGRNADVFKRIINRTHCQMSGSLENDTDVNGSIRYGARKAYNEL